MIDGVAKSISDCMALSDPWWKRFHQFNPVWNVDPPAFRSPGDRQLWVMGFGGVRPGDGFSASFGDRQVQTVRANALGQAVLAVLDSAHSPERLSLEFKAAPGGGARGLRPDVHEPGRADRSGRVHLLRARPAAGGRAPAGHAPAVRNARRRLQRCGRVGSRLSGYSERTPRRAPARRRDRRRRRDRFRRRAAGPRRCAHGDARDALLRLGPVAPGARGERGRGVLSGS